MRTVYIVNNGIRGIVKIMYHWSTYTGTFSKPTSYDIWVCKIVQKNGMDPQFSATRMYGKPHVVPQTSDSLRMGFQSWSIRLQSQPICITRYVLCARVKTLYCIWFMVIHPRMGFLKMCVWFPINRLITIHQYGKSTHVLPCHIQLYNYNQLKCFWSFFSWILDIRW